MSLELLCHPKGRTIREFEDWLLIRIFGWLEKIA
jgi:hypothetical protein